MSAPAAASTRRSAQRPLRVVTLIDEPTVDGGAERVAWMLAAGIDSSRFTRTLCATRPLSARTAPSELEAAGVRVLALRRRSPYDLAAWRPLLALLRRERVDILHAHMFGSNLWGTLGGRLAGVPVVIAHEHTWSFEGEPLRRFLDRHVVARGASAYCAVCEADRRRMIEVEGIPPHVIRLVPNGIPPLEPPRHDVRAELGIAPLVPVVATVGQLRRQKAFHVLVEATRLLVRDLPAVRVLIAGGGDEEQALRSLIAAHGLEEHVLMLGPRRDVPDILAGCDVAVCSSDFEGLPLSVMEYMAAGKPVVGTRVGGVPDLVEDGVTGLLVPPRDAPALAGALRALLTQPQRAAAMGVRGRERQRREFDLGVFLRRFEALYEELFLQTRCAREEGWQPAR
jgi:glycosyltransferase involved in cell wall biosynthesis